MMGIRSFRMTIAWIALLIVGCSTGEGFDFFRVAIPKIDFPVRNVPRVDLPEIDFFKKNPSKSNFTKTESELNQEFESLVLE